MKNSTSLKNLDNPAYFLPVAAILAQWCTRASLLPVILLQANWQLTLGVYFIGALIGPYVLGDLSDNISRKWSMIFGLIFVVLAQIVAVWGLYIVRHEYLTLYLGIAAAIHGAMGNPSPAAQAAISETIYEKDRDRIRKVISLSLPLRYVPIFLGLCAINAPIPRGLFVLPMLILSGLTLGAVYFFFINPNKEKVEL